MFTQCPKCQTVFRLSADVLRAAAGEVRCGRCGGVFNALSTLTQDAGAFISGDSFSDQEARADNILRFPLAPGEAPPDLESESESGSEFETDGGEPGVEVAHLKIEAHEEDAELRRQIDAQTQEDDDSFDYGSLADDRSLEFTLPPGELDRIFVAARAHSLPLVAAKVTHEAMSDLEPTGTYPILIIDDAATAAEERAEAGIQTGAAFDPDATMDNHGSGVPATAHEDSIERIDPDSLWHEIDRQSRPKAGGWIAVAAMFTVFFIAQVVHHEREALADVPGIGSAVHSLYATLGVSLPMHSNLAAFDLRQWGVTGDAGANGILRVRASMINRAAQSQPFPLLRVTLADRFGAKLGSRDFEAAEYLHQPPSDALAAGAHADAWVDIADPGKNAEGFEIDVCAPNARRGTICANDLAARPR